MDDFWEATDYFTGPALTDEMIAKAERDLGYKLPDSYLALIRTRNGGTPRRTCCPTNKRTSWAKDHIAISGVKGIGGDWGIDSPNFGNKAMIREWGYPSVGVVVCECPSAGHDVVMLDYNACGPEGEPRVIHVETETAEVEVTLLAPDFAAFLRVLVPQEHFNYEAPEA